MDILIYLLLIVSIIIVIGIKSKRSLHMLQSNLYNENNRYLKWVVKNRREFLGLDLICFFISISGLLVLYSFKDLLLLMIFIISVLFLTQSFILYKRIHSVKTKKPLVITARIKRLIITNTILNAIPLVLLFLNLNNEKLVFLFLTIISVVVILNYFVVFIAMLINMPIEKLVYLHFKNMAQEKLESINDLKIIGITGSYGKTSCKNILADILNIKYNA